jgi:hypothetical protein
LGRTTRRAPKLEFTSQGELREKFLLLTRHCSAHDMGEMLDRVQNLERESNLDWIGVRAQ